MVKINKNGFNENKLEEFNLLLTVSRSYMFHNDFYLIYLLKEISEITKLRLNNQILEEYSFDYIKNNIFWKDKPIPCIVKYDEK